MTQLNKCPNIRASPLESDQVRVSGADESVQCTLPVVTTVQLYTVQRNVSPVPCLTASRCRISCDSASVPVT